MSIWSTWLAFDTDEDHGPTRAYKGNHVMPDESHHPGPVFDIAAIPADVFDESAVDKVEPWLRISLGTTDAVIDRAQVEALWDALSLWLYRQKPETRKDGS